MPSSKGGIKEKEIACYLFPFLEDRNTNKGNDKRKEKPSDKQQKNSASSAATDVGSKRKNNKINSKLRDSSSNDRSLTQYGMDVNSKELVKVKKSFPSFHKIIRHTKIPLGLLEKVQMTALISMQFAAVHHQEN